MGERTVSKQQYVRRVAIVNPLRTPVGTFGGALRDVAVEDLAATVVREVVGRSGIDPERIDDAVFAQSYANSEVPCVGRWVALHAGLPIGVPGMQLDRRCGGGLQALVTASMMVQTGAADVVLAGGVESMSRIEYYSTATRWGARAGTVSLYDRLDRGRERSQPEERFGRISGMIETAENLASDYKVDRESADAYAARSHQRAAAAWKDGRFDDEVVPVSVPQRRGEPRIFAADEGVRPDSTPETLAKLRSIQPGGTVTAGNASQQNDAAAACLVVAEDRLDDLGLTPIGFFDGWAAAGCDPSRMGIGPVPAVAKLAARQGIDTLRLLNGLDLVELNEAFAVQVLAVLEGWGWRDHDRLNVNGSGISLGHPIGATGMRMVTTLLHELHRRGGGKGLATMCIGGGQGLAATVEAV
jgi:acetyl-CoA C-acetyltransferase